MFLKPDYKLLITDLPEIVESVSDDFTLMDLFKAVANAEIYPDGLAIFLGMNFFSDFYREIKQEPTERSDLDYLQLSWCVDYDFNRNSKEDPTKAQLFNLMDVGGIGKHECAFEGSCPNGCPEKDLYGIDMSPICDLAHLTIRLDPEIKMYEPYTKDGKVLSRTGFTLAMDPTLYTFITSIFWELTFFGTPEYRDKQLADVKETMKLLDAGEIETIP